ncbi:hypothetical protein ACMUDX_19095, partial [Vibrio cholerae]|uniref:hypothetical protein n=1 Tax=Vibrio cholerae TaxID=666 RepID=UPI0039C8E91B
LVGAVASFKQRIVQPIGFMPLRERLDAQRHRIERLYDDTINLEGKIDVLSRSWERVRANDFHVAQDMGVAQEKASGSLLMRIVAVH